MMPPPINTTSAVCAMDDGLLCGPRLCSLPSASVSR
jgi:hypothetical protein